MFIEDLFIKLNKFSIKMNMFDSNVLTSIQNQINSKINLTEKQANLCLSILNRYEKKISEQLGQDVSVFLKNPQFKYPFRVTNSEKTISVCDHPSMKRAIMVKFPYDEKIISKFREQRSTINYGLWSDHEKCWFFSLDERSINFLSPLIEEFGFKPDHEFQDYLDQTNEIKKNIEKYIPMVVKTPDGIKFVNISEHTPQNSSNDLLESLFLARKIGIYTWDEHIDQELKEKITDEEAKKFLTSDPSEKYELFLDEKSLFSVSNIVKNLFPCLVVLPDNNELSRISSIIEFFKTLDITEKEMTVLFRLPTATGADFNNFVKEQHLNNPVSQDTKVVFINSNIPKVILNPRINFNCVLNYKFYSAHFKLREYLRNQPNIIGILEKTPNRRFTFDNL